VYTEIVSSPREPVVLAFVSRLNRSLFLFCFLVLVLYALGNYQEFLDADQLMLLGVVRSVTLVGSLLGGYTIAGRLLMAVRRSLRAGAVVADALLFVANVVLLVGVELLLAWVRGPAATAAPVGFGLTP
jgi:hypothetical protein